MIKINWKFVGKIICVSILAAQLNGCDTKKEISFNDQQLIKGNATPVLLSPDKTEINLEDYVLDISKIDSITTPVGFSKSVNGNILTLEGNLSTWLGDVTLWQQGQAYSIPLQKSTKSTITITYAGNAKSVKVKGEFNAWNPADLIKNENNHSLDLSIYPGNYQYVLVLDGKERRDLTNNDSVSNGMGGWNSVIRIPRADRKKLPLVSTDHFTDQTITLALQQPATEIHAYWKNFLLTEPSVVTTDQSVQISIPSQAKNEKRSFIRVWTANAEGISNDVLIPLDSGKVVSKPSQLVRQDKEAQVLYFLMVDRFKNGKKENDEPVNDKSIHPKANYFGGDIAGVTQKMKDGYFSQMGINTLWLSPITQNPKGAYGKYPNPPTTFSGYHGYWPVSLQQIDYRFGTKQEVEELIRLAHEQNINVILDYVAHHVHELHPLYKLHPEWFTPLYLPDGTRNTERWDDQRLTTWFDVFMPTLDLRKPEVVGPMTDTAMYWVEKFDLDGFRHDASKHIDLLFWRELTKKVKSKIDRPVFQIGETYGSRELVNSYVNTGMLDAQFDFNVYDDAVNTFAVDETPFTRLSNSITESISWFGDHNVMGYISGNQDRARFISYADGSIRFNEDAKKAGWTRKIEIQDSIGYKKLRALHAFNLTIPGVPCIYYGDENGDPGGNDPDNRRMMRFDQLNPSELYTRNTTAKLIKLRKENLALTYGDFNLVSVSDQQLVYKRKYFSNEVTVAFNKSNQPVTIQVGILPKETKTNFNGTLQLQNKESLLTLPAYSFEILIAENK